MKRKRGSTAKKRKLGVSKLVAMRMSPGLMQMATDKAAASGISRSQYIEVLVRKDLDVEGVDLDAPSPDATTVFG